MPSCPVKQLPFQIHQDELHKISPDLKMMKWVQFDTTKTGSELCLPL